MKYRTSLRRTAACAALCSIAASSGALAQSATSQVTLSGAIDLYAGRMQLAGRSNAQVVNPSGLTTSYWGIQVTEDLGSGLRAQVHLFSFMTPDNGGMGRYTGDSAFSRRSSVGLAGDFGEINLGRIASPYFVTLVAFDPFAGSSLGPVFQHTYAGGQPLQASMVVGDSSILNSVNYQTPSLGGFRLNTSYGFGEQPNNSGANRLAASLTYNNGPLALAAVAERNKAQIDVGETRQEDLMLAGSYDFKVVQAFAELARHKKTTLGIEYRTLQLGASVPIGPAKLLASWVRTNYESPVIELKRNTISVVYDYFLSRRTDVYAGVANDRLTAVTNGNSVVAGLRHRF